MADVFSKKKRSEVMRSIKSKGTKLETDTAKMLRRAFKEMMKEGRVTERVTMPYIIWRELDEPTESGQYDTINQAIEDMMLNGMDARRKEIYRKTANESK